MLGGDEATVAIIHGSIEMNNKTKNITKIQNIIEKLGENHVDLIIVPQMINGVPLYRYSVGVKKIKQTTETIPGSTSQEISDMANKYNKNLLVGPILERRGTKLYRSAFLVIPMLGLKGVVRQLETSNDYGSGLEAPIFDMNKFKVGILIAEDVFYPEISLILNLINIDVLVFYPTLEMDLYKQRHLIVMRAIENKCTSIMIGGTITRKGEALLEIPTIAVDENGDIIEEIIGTEDKILLIKINVKEKKESITRHRRNVLLKLRKTLPYFTK
mgnify:CR=1 FL=1